MNRVRYHNILSGPTGLPTPDNADSTANGTSIFPWNVFGTCSPFGVIAYSHNPLRFFHSALIICGLGYSGSGFEGSTFPAHSVTILSPEIFQPSFCGIAIPF